MPQHRLVVGFIGLGAIGTPMAERLVSAGEDVIVFNRTAAKTGHFRGRARIAVSPAEMADEADIVFACVTTAESYHDVVLGPSGIARGRRVRTYVHLGTNEVALVEALAEVLEARGIATLDAPMTGGVAGAAAGVLTVMASGPRAVYERALPLIQHYARKIVFVGERIGAAQAMKFVNNVLSAGNLALACEVLVFGMKYGLDPDAMLDVINHGSGQNHATLTKIPEHILPRTFGFGASLGLAVENMDAFRAEARLADVPIPLAEAIIGAIRTAAAEEGSAADVTRIVRPMERAAGATVSAIGAMHRANAAAAAAVSAAAADTERPLLRRQGGSRT